MIAMEWPIRSGIIGLQEAESMEMDKKDKKEEVLELTDDDLDNVTGGYYIYDLNNVTKKWADRLEYSSSGSEEPQNDDSGTASGSF